MLSTITTNLNNLSNFLRYIAKYNKNPKKAIDFMENYRWSSFQDYIGKKNYPSVTQRKFLTKFFNGPQEYKKHIQEWLRDMRLDEIKKLIFE